MFGCQTGKSRFTVPSLRAPWVLISVRDREARKTLTPSLLGTMRMSPAWARGTTLVARAAAWPRHGLEEEASWPRGIVPYSSRRTARHLAGGYETSHIHSPLSVGSPTP